MVLFLWRMLTNCLQCLLDFQMELMNRLESVLVSHSGASSKPEIQGISISFGTKLTLIDRECREGRGVLRQARMRPTWRARAAPRWTWIWPLVSEDNTGRWLFQESREDHTLRRKVCSAMSGVSEVSNPKNTEHGSLDFPWCSLMILTRAVLEKRVGTRLGWND